MLGDVPISYGKVMTLFSCHMPVVSGLGKGSLSLGISWHRGCCSQWRFPGAAGACTSPGSPWELDGVMTVVD